MVDLKSKFRSILTLEVVKIFSYTTLSTLVKMLTGLVSVKIVAILIGPAGIALLGQLNNFATIVMTLASGGINNGVTKYVSEYKSSDTETSKILSTGFKITGFCSCVIGLLLIVFNNFLSSKVLLSSDYGYVFLIFGLALNFYAFNSFLISILNGFKEFKLFVSVNIVGSILGLIFTITLVYFGGLKGALVSAISFQSVMLFVTLYMIRKVYWLNKSFFWEKFDKKWLRRYMGFSVMALVTAATSPISQLVLRVRIINEISQIEAGWWEAINRISNMYLLVITTTLSVYYLPKLSEISSNHTLKHELIKAYKLITPILLIGFIIIYLLRFTVIKVLFTSEFQGMEKLFFWQLLGDFLKISSWLLAFLMVAKAMTKTYVITEVVFTLIFIILSFYFMQFNGIVGVTQALSATYLGYFICMLILFRKILFTSNKGN
ncbi:O-antigen translocase [Sphingobacterium siyangense]|uniref:O-antigen translocase n=1 Tax=Sphingobacterium siyangense TaxID=459529 RepID=UPI003DA40BC3